MQVSLLYLTKDFSYRKMLVDLSEITLGLKSCYKLATLKPKICSSIYGPAARAPCNKSGSLVKGACLKTCSRSAHTTICHACSAVLGQLQFELSERDFSFNTLCCGRNLFVLVSFSIFLA